MNDLDRVKVDVLDLDALHATDESGYDDQIKKHNDTQNLINLSNLMCKP